MRLPAFPYTGDDRTEPHSGIDERMYIAIRAMQALIQKYDCPDYEIAKQAYDIAEAMINEDEDRN